MKRSTGRPAKGSLGGRKYMRKKVGAMVNGITETDLCDHPSLEVLPTACAETIPRAIRMMAIGTGIHM